MRWDLTPSNDEIALLMEAGLIYRDAGRTQEARDVFNGVRALAPQSEAPEVALGTVSENEHDFDGAEKHLRRALEINPKSAYAYAHLGELELCRKSTDRAIPHLKKALELDPRGDFGKMARSLLDFAEAVQF